MAAPKKTPKATKATKTTPKSGRPAAAKKPAGKSAKQDAGPLVAGDDWRPRMLSRVRTLIKQADPEVVEEVKWRKPSNAMQGVPTWSHDGLICTGETYKSVVKLTFAKGAALDDPTGLFNAADTGATRRAIDLREGDDLDETAFEALIREAVDLNTAK